MNPANVTPTDDEILALRRQFEQAWLHRMIADVQNEETTLDQSVKLGHVYCELLRGDAAHVKSTAALAKTAVALAKTDAAESAADSPTTRLSATRPSATRLSATRLSATRLAATRRGARILSPDAPADPLRHSPLVRESLLAPTPEADGLHPSVFSPTPPSTTETPSPVSSSSRASCGCDSDGAPYTRADFHAALARSVRDLYGLPDPASAPSPSQGEGRGEGAASAQSVLSATPDQPAPAPPDSS